ncbi:MAG TPA: penicillin acylase family protein, partial [Bacteroidales bacterium]|nr:penicillin acylase family protein [Bacteroidales bacterium]
MKLLKKVLIGLAVIVAVVVVASAIIVRHVARRALPDYNQTVQTPYLMEEVTVLRDQHAIPYVFAKNESDLYFTVGYVMAQDRLWQMDLLRRVTMGRLSEIFGEDMIETDLLLRALRISEKSNMVLAGTEPTVISALEAFARGVNYFIETQGNRLPPEFTLLGYKPEPWQPIHSVNLIGYMAWDLSGAWQIEATMNKLRQHLEEEKFLQLLPNMAHHPTFVYPVPNPDAAGQLTSLLQPATKLKDLGLEVFSASNSWAVSGAKSTTGKPILANDMHLGFGAPGIWYQMKHEVEGSMKVAGVVLPGQPFVIVGHNEYFAWGMTNVYVDDADFFLETINPENPDQYLYNGQWLDMKIRQEKIALDDGDTVVRELRFTHRGPIISEFREIKDQAISMQWTGNLPSNEVRTMYLLNHGRNWDDFRNALRTMTSISQNVIYADVYGNIGLQTAAGVPMRNDGNGLFIYPGHTSQYNWTGLVPFEELPFSFNPPGGKISTANNRTIDESYPHHIGYQFAMPFRIDRIREMLDQKEKFSSEDFKIMLGDFCSKKAERYLPALIEIAGAANLDEKSRQALELLRNWDMVYSVNSSQPAIFDMFYIRMVHNLV